MRRRGATAIAVVAPHGWRMDRTIMAERTQRQHAQAQDCSNARPVRRLAFALGAGAFVLVAALATLPLLANRLKPAPQVQLTNIAGEAKSFAALHGRPVLVSLRSTTCAPCLPEMPPLVAPHRRHAERGLTTFAVAMRDDRPDMVLDFARTRGLPFDVVLDFKGEIARDFGDPRVTPAKYLMDAQGRIVRVYVGRTDFENLERRIAAELTG
jgi:peroxiredoxin